MVTHKINIVQHWNQFSSLIQMQGWASRTSRENFAPSNCFESICLKHFVYFLLQGMVLFLRSSLEIESILVWPSNVCDNIMNKAFCSWQFLKMLNTKNERNYWVHPKNEKRNVTAFLSELKFVSIIFYKIYRHDCDKFPSFVGICKYKSHQLYKTCNNSRWQEVEFATVVVGSDMSTISGSH